MLGLGTGFNWVGNIFGSVGGVVDSIAGLGDGLVQNTLGRLPLVGGAINYGSNALFSGLGWLASAPFDLVSWASNGLGSLFGGGGGRESAPSSSSAGELPSLPPPSGLGDLGSLSAPSLPQQRAAGGREL